ncbi:50S ribosomal protein L37ae [Candidatus Micrarchaeota archaeon]|nr:50S ribosomal protein L37ae [Candidatus Micrarchaeota archaeon]MBI5177254.1 50S ribosomal protein L37ae [Candidatus Micrarchaeota archaeon]
MVSRYGVKTRKLHAAAVRTSRAKHACPKCGKRSVRRDGYAVWHCLSCKVRFAGGAYSPETMVGAAAKRALRQAPAVSKEE